MTCRITKNIEQAETTRPLNIAPCHSSDRAELCGARHLVLVLLGALDLGGTAELLGAVLPLLACNEDKRIELDR